MNIGDSVKNDFKDKGHQLWIDLDYLSQKVFIFRDWFTIQRTLDSNELILNVYTEIIDYYEIR
jgi:hypothetical protein